MFLRQNDKKHLRIPAKAGIHKWIPVFTGMLTIIMLSFSPAFAATTIPFTINMSEAVNVTGTPRIAVDVDGNTRYATYASGTGTSALVFNYAAIAGDVDLDGVALSSPIQLNGGTIKDLNGNDATLTFTVPNTSNVRVNYPSLGMDFTNGASGRYTLNGTAYTTLPSFLTATGGTFTRASVGTYFDSTGTLQTATANTPRFDYDPVTLAPKGILIEESRTNKQLYSNSFTASGWTNVGTINSNLPGLQSATSASKLSETSESNIHHAFRGTTDTTLNGTFTLSIFAKLAERQYITIKCASSATDWAAATFDLSSAANTKIQTSGNYSSGSTKITASGGGWHRISLVFTTTSASGGIAIYPSITGIPSYGNFADVSYTGTSGNGVYIEGAQLEQGSFATSFIPTTTAAVTRSADNLTIPTGGWYNASISTLYGHGLAAGSTSGSAATFADLNDNSFNNRFQIRINSGPFYSGIITSGNVVQSSIGSGTYTFGTAKKIAMASQFNDAAIYADGSSRGTDATVTMPVSISRLRIGAVGSGFEYLNGNLQTIKYYPARVTNTQLQLLTQ